MKQIFTYERPKQTLAAQTGRKLSRPPRGPRNSTGSKDAWTVTAACHHCRLVPDHHRWDHDHRWNHDHYRLRRLVPDYHRLRRLYPSPSSCQPVPQHSKPPSTTGRRHRLSGPPANTCRTSGIAQTVRWASAYELSLNMIHMFIIVCYLSLLILP